MAIELLALELILGAMLLGGIIAYGRSLGERLCLLATVPVAYLLSFLLAKGGVWDFIGGSIVSLLVNIDGLGGIFETSAATKTGLEALISCILRPIMTVVLFWLLLLVLRILVPLILKLCKADRASFFRADSEPVWRKILTCAVGVVGAYAICMLSFLPLTFMGNLAKPAVEKAQNEAYAGTYVQEVLHTADVNILSAVGDTFGGKMQKYTGFGAILTASANSLSDVSLKGNDGKEVAFNGTELVQGLLCDGVDALAVYEYTYNPDQHTVGDVAHVSNILIHIADSEAILQIGSELISNALPEAEEKDEESPLSDQLLAVLLTAYAKGDTEVMKGDLETIAGLLDKLAVDFDDRSLDSDALTEDLLAYLTNKNSSYDIVRHISALSVYPDMLSILSEYGMNALCDILEISNDNIEYYEKFFTDLHTVLNNERVEGIYYRDAVEGFIRYLVENDLSVSDCVKNNTDENIASAYESYQRYMAQVDPIREVLVNYHMDERDGTFYFVATDGSVFAYNARNEKWSACENESELSKSSLMIDLLLSHVNALFEENIEYSISHEEIRALAAQYTVAHLQELYPALSAAIATDTAALASMICSSDAFAPDVIYRDEIIFNLKTDVTVDEDHNRTFAAIISTAATFADKLADDETENPISLVLENFSLVGRLLDELHAFELTADVPGDILIAITQSSDFGSYFLSDSIAELVENVKNDVSTYEELFTSVQALYNIINQIVPV